MKYLFHLFGYYFAAHLMWHFCDFCTKLSPQWDLIGSCSVELSSGMRCQGLCDILSKLAATTLGSSSLSPSLCTYKRFFPSLLPIFMKFLWHSWQTAPIHLDGKQIEPKRFDIRDDGRIEIPERGRRRRRETFITMKRLFNCLRIYRKSRRLFIENKTKNACMIDVF